MKTLPKLKAAFLEEGTTANKVAKETDIPRSYISQAIHGRYNLDEVQKAKIAKVLNRKPEELFN